MDDKFKPVGNPPRGWHMKNEYIDEEGNVFVKGDFSHTINLEKTIDEEVVTKLIEELPTEPEEVVFTPEEIELNKNVSKLRRRIAELNIEKEFKQKTWDYNKPWSEYIKLTQLEEEEIDKLNKELRLIRPYKTTDIPNHGTIMTLNQFKNSVKNGVFIDSDGSGNYIETDADGNMKMTDVPIYPSDVKEKSLRYKLNKIVWFNK